MLLLFDCDGVLVDSEIISARANCELLARYGYEISPEEMAHRFAGLTTEVIFRRVAEEMGRELPDTLIREAQVETDRRLDREVEAIEGVGRMLDSLDDPRCICSNSRPERLELTLRRAGLWDRFRPYVFSAQAVRQGRGKPSPDVYLHALEVFETAPADALVVEDSVAGTTAAVAAGVRVIGFTGASHTWPGHGDALTDAGALTTIRRMADLPATVEALRDWVPDGI
jgi:HAD superfamily hydrolase (TIGR01509 family)